LASGTLISDPTFAPEQPDINIADTALNIDTETNFDIRIGDFIFSVNSN